MSTFCRMIVLLWLVAIELSTAFLSPTIQNCKQRQWHYMYSGAAVDRATSTHRLGLRSDAAHDNDVGIIHAFVNHVETSLRGDTFLSLRLKGPSIPKRQRQEQAERLRGCIRQVTGRRVALSKQKGVLQLTIKFHGATDVVKNYPQEEVSNTLLALMMLSPSPSSSSVLASEWGDAAMHAIGTPHGIQHGELVTTNTTVTLTAKLTHPPFQLLCTIPEHQSNATSTLHNHDLSKQVPVDQRASFLQALGLTDSNGKPRPKMTSKLKQCQKFVEICSNLIADSTNDKSSSISIVDMACGRGYLTFSLHSHLKQYYPKVQSLGIDVRPKLVTEMTNICTLLGNDFDGLTFSQGTIESMLVLNTTTASTDNNNVVDDDALQVLIALHACDTATDDALWFGISNQMNVLVVAPCCHKQVRRQLDTHFASMEHYHPLQDVLRHNIYRERMAEQITDSIRALLLELHDYHVKVFEFVGSEHGGKNVMITATKRQHPRTAKELHTLRQRLKDLASLHGVQHHKLATWMNESLIHHSDAHDQANNNNKVQRKLSVKEMPPLPYSN